VQRFISKKFPNPLQPPEFDPPRDRTKSFMTARSLDSPTIFAVRHYCGAAPRRLKKFPLRAAQAAWNRKITTP
jgi:hypothetical protein